MPFKPIYRQFAPPPLRTPSFLPEPVYMDSQIPEADPGLHGPPPPLQSPGVRINAPVPPEEQSSLQQYDTLQKERPAPVGGWRRAVKAGMRGGIPGLISELVDPSAKREEFAQKQEALKGRIDLEHKQNIDDTNTTYKGALAENMRGQRREQDERLKDADLNRELSIGNAGWQEVTGSEPPELGNPGEPPMWEYARINGKRVRRPSEYAKTKSKREGEMATWQALPPEVADTLKIPRDRKIDPKDFDKYERLYQAAQQSKNPTVPSLALQAAGGDATKALKLIKESHGSNTIQLTGGNGGGLDDPALDMAADVYARTGQLPAVGMGRDAAALRTKIMNRAARLNPGADLALNRAEYGAGKGSLAQLQKQKGQIIAFENTATRNLDIALEASNRVDRTGSPLINKYMLFVKGQVAGDKDTALLRNAVTTAANEYAKVISGATGGVVTDAARTEAEGMLSAAMTKGTFPQVVAQMKREMENRRAGFDSQIEEVRTGLGRKPPTQTPQQPQAPARQRATNPKTGEVLEFDGKQWVKVAQ